MIGQRKIDGFNIGVAQAHGLQQGVQGRCIAHARGIHGEFHAFEVLDLAIASTLHMIPANEDFGRSITRGRGSLVGNDLDLDTAEYRIVEAGGGGACAGLDLTGAQWSNHVRSRTKIRYFDVETFGLEIALPVGDVDGGVAGAARGSDHYGLSRKRQHRCKQDGSCKSKSSTHCKRFLLSVTALNLHFRASMRDLNLTPPKLADYCRSMASAGAIRISAEILRELIARMFVATGVRHQAADRVAAGLVEADLQGLSSHGVMLMDMYIERLRHGSVSTKETAAVVCERDAAVVLD